MNYLPSQVLQLSTIDTCFTNVFKSLTVLHQSMTAGCDGINPLVLKKNSVSLCEPVSYYFVCLEIPYLPSERRTHKIVPIYYYKKRAPIDVCNYRSISLICMSKVLKLNLYNDILLLFLCPQISSCQYGFVIN